MVGIPDEYRGEAPKAYVKLKQGREVTADEMLEFLKPKISKLEMPSEIEFRDELPKTMIGKAIQEGASPGTGSGLAGL